jgi:hypothetical protein
MTVLDRPSTSLALETLVKRPTFQALVQVKCVVCHKSFDFGAGQTAVVLKHIAYGYDFAHPGKCEAIAREWIFVEPGYDRPAFSTDGQRVRVLSVSSAAGWSAVLPAAPEQVLDGVPVLYERLAYWAVVEHRDGSRHTEGVIRAAEWLNEPGGAEFVEARHGRYTYRGKVERLSSIAR